MTSVTIFPNRKKVGKDDTDKARALLAATCLEQLVGAAKAQVDPATWVKVGGLELEDFLNAIHRGRPHPLLREWEQVKATTAANRPAPSLRELWARRLGVLMCVALERADCTLGKRQARQRAAKVLAKIAAFSAPPSANAIEHWQRSAPALTPYDEQVIALATEHAGGIERYIYGLILSVLDPLALIVPD